MKRFDSILSEEIELEAGDDEEDEDEERGKGVADMRERLQNVSLPGPREKAFIWGFEEDEHLHPLHPVFVCPGDAAKKLRDWAEKDGRAWVFWRAVGLFELKHSLGR